MPKTHPLRQKLLEKILSQPSAPFREWHVLKLVQETLAARKIPFFSDPSGNLVIGAGSAAAYRRVIQRKAAEPLRIFVGHTDHPGFVGTHWEKNGLLAAEWQGGGPLKLLKGARVWLADRKYPGLGEGRVKRVTFSESGRYVDRIWLEVEKDVRGRQPEASAIYGGYSFRSTHWQDGDRMYTKAADDLVGAFAVVSLALDLYSHKRKGASRPPFIGLLTRAEEVGYIGAIAHFEAGWLKNAGRPLVFVSLETSRALPGAAFGKGPVVRLGDRTTVFNPDALRVLIEVAEKVLPKRHQRRIMDVGTCEATAATAYRLPAIGISVPLGNYHNQSFEGGPDSRGADGPAPEFVHLSDIQGMIELCHGLLAPGLPWKNPWRKRAENFRKDLKFYKRLLKTGP